MSPRPLAVTEEQVLWFRARRWHLAGPGAKDAAAAARALLGAQSQQLAPSLLGLSQRLAARPTAAELEARLLEERTLVRTWGQRDTLFLFDPAAHWARVVAARGEWSAGGRRMLMPTDGLLAKARAFVRKAKEPVTRTDLLPLVPAAYARECDRGLKEAKIPWKQGDGERFAAGRLLWRLAHDGELYAGPKRGAEQTYAPRALGYGRLDWDPPDARTAACRLTADYLASYGPATAADVAYFFGAKITVAREWLADLGEAGRLVEVRCGEREGLVLCAEDARDLKRPVPKGARDWPPRLLPLWDAVLMGHADKRWTLPDAAEERLVWRKAGVVAATVVDRGRLVATWNQKKTKKLLRVELTPLSGWSARRHRAGVEREAAAVAAHLGIPAAQVELL